MLPSDPLRRVKRLQRRAESGASRDLALLVSQIGATGRDAVARLRPVPQTSAELAVPASRPAPIEPDPVGMEDPRDVAATIPLVERAFVFLDLCGFTGFMAVHGEHAAIDALSSFRSLTRDIAARRGVRAAKWLGDGAMIVGVEVGPAIAAGVELVARYDGHTLALRGGIAHGRVLLFDGDDYIGRPANLAARLCQAARPGELLALGYPRDTLPPWVEVSGTRDITLHGLGRIRRIQQLGLVPGLDLPRSQPRDHD
jgi:adenylate cyclase